MLVYGYVIMSNHIYIILRSENGKISDLIRDFKKFTARSILDKIQTEPESRREWMLNLFELAIQSHSRNKKYQFWQCGNHFEEIYTNKFMWSKLDYTRFNLVRAGLMEKASHYFYPSASNYVYDVGLISINKADNPIVDVASVNNMQRYNWCWSYGIAARSEIFAEPCADDILRLCSNGIINFEIYKMLRSWRHLLSIVMGLALLC